MKKSINFKIVGLLSFSLGCSGFNPLQTPLTITSQNITYCPTMPPTNPIIVTLQGTGFSKDTKVFVGTIEAVIIPQSDPLNDKMLSFYCPSQVGAQGQKFSIQASDSIGMVELPEAITYYLSSIVFSASQTRTVLSGDQPVSIITGDFDNDSNHMPDIAVSFSDMIAPSNKIDILSNDGTGAFLQNALLQISFGGTPHPQIEAADFNKDDLIDIVFIDQKGTNAYIATQATGGYNGSIIPVGRTIRYLISADLNGDGYVDFATANEDNSNMNRLSILFNNQKTTGMLGFSSVMKYLPNDPQFLLAQDFDRNGDTDLLVASADMPAMSLLLNDKGNLSNFPLLFILDAQVTPNLGVANLFSKNGSLPDIALINTTTMGKRIDIYENISVSTVINYSQSFSSANIPSSPMNSISKITTTDIDLDGFADLIVNSGKEISIFINKAREKGEANISFYPPISIPSGLIGSNFLQSFVMIDANKDGFLDLVAIPNQGTDIIIYKNISM